MKKLSRKGAKAQRREECIAKNSQILEKQGVLPGFSVPDLCVFAALRENHLDA